MPNRDQVLYPGEFLLQGECRRDVLPGMPPFALAILAKWQGEICLVDPLEGEGRRIVLPATPLRIVRGGYDS
ncbi:MAG: hypothetical protein D6812_06120 [Deltaproteobacteria bacterium]|nr:MAG: hypothetical protein D6812_06120 [Deltaproteobacteria bacterium]